MMLSPLIRPSGTFSPKGEKEYVLWASSVLGFNQQIGNQGSSVAAIAFVIQV